MPRRGGLAERALFADEVVFVMSTSHRLASRSTLTRADLQDEALFTSRAPTRDMGWFLKPLAGRKTDRPLNYQVLPLTEAVVDFARAGLGIGVLSEWVAAPHLRHGELIAKRLTSGAILRPWRLVWRKPVESIALHLAQILEQAAPRLRVVSAGASAAANLRRRPARS
jgi:LysR family transcriptional regulator for metE and metH